MRMPDDPAPGDYDDHYIASILRSEARRSTWIKPSFSPHAMR
jgi:hypothetical protein